MSDSTFELALPDPFSFQMCLSYLNRSPQESLYSVDNEGITRLLRIGNHKRLIRLTSPEQTSMHVQLLHGSPFTASELERLSQYLREWFDLDRDLQPFYKEAAGDPLFAPVAAAFHGLRIVGIPDLFEAICWAIVGQQINLTFAYKLKRRIAEEYGESEYWEGQRFQMFPSPERFQEVSVEQLGQLQLTRNKAASILEVATRIAKGELTKSMLLALPSGQAMEEALTSIRGIGPWTAHYVRMRCLRDASAFPVTDVGLQNAVKLLLGMDRKPTIPELQELFSKWPGWEAYVTFYLWRTLY